MKLWPWMLLACAAGMFAIGKWSHYQSAERTAYARGYAAAVDSVRNVSAPPETLRVVVRRGQSVTVWEPSGNGMQVWP